MKALRIRDEASLEALDGNEAEAKVLKMFDKAGADWSARDSRGRTLLHHVAGHADIDPAISIHTLVGHGIDPKIQDVEGRTARDTAIQANNTLVVEILERL